MPRFISQFLRKPAISASAFQNILHNPFLIVLARERHFLSCSYICATIFDSHNLVVVVGTVHGILKASTWAWSRACISHNLFLKKFFIYIGIQLINNVVIVSGVQQKLIQLYKCMCLFFFKFFSHLGCYIILSRVSCAIQQVLVGCPF